MSAHPFTTTMRRTLALGLAMTMPVLLVACGSDDAKTVASKAKKIASTITTTTKPGDSPTTTGATSTGGGSDAPTTQKDAAGATTQPSKSKAPTTTEAPTDPKAFDRSMSQLKASIDAAKGDACKIVTALQTSTAGGSPSSPAQAESAYNVIAATLNALADSAPPESAADSNLVRGAVKKMMDSAKADNYSVTQFAGGGPKALQSEELGAALSRLFQSIATKCGLPGANGTK